MVEELCLQRNHRGNHPPPDRFTCEEPAAVFRTVLVTDRSVERHDRHARGRQDTMTPDSPQELVSRFYGRRTPLLSEKLAAAMAALDGLELDVGEELDVVISILQKQHYRYRSAVYGLIESRNPQDMEASVIYSIDATRLHHSLDLLSSIRFG